ncbi:MAG: succinate dehydrogenase assembly factor 2 [Syntrophobacterales bacterium]|nr:succinate dehydrogenase assembly factor 2 [Syntrophobacterales bacterium]
MDSIMVSDENNRLLILKKKIAYHVARRANLELETLLVKFWRCYGETLSYERLKELERFLEMDDLDLLEMILGKREVASSEWIEFIRLIRDAWRKDST